MRAVVAGVALGLVLASAGCPGKAGSLSLGCTSGPGRTTPSAAPATGRVAWSVPLKKGHDVSGHAAIGPLLYVPTSMGVQDALETHDNGFTAYDPADGRSLWRQDGVLDQLDAAAGTLYFSGVTGNVLFASNARNARWRWMRFADSERGEPSLGAGGMRAALGPGAVLAYRGGESSGYLARIDDRGSVMWTLAHPPHMIREVLVRGDAANVDSYDLEDTVNRFDLSAVEASTGQVRWQREVTQPWEIREHGGRLGAILGSDEVDGPATLVMIDGRTGTTLWSHVLGGYVFPFEFTYAEFTAGGFLHSYAGRLTMYDAATGKVRWAVDTKPQPANRERNRSHAPGLIRTAPNGILVSGDDYVSCLDPATGAERWHTPTDVAFIDDIAVAGDVAYAMGLRDPVGEDFSPVSYLLCLDLRTGTPLWRYQRDGAAMTYLASTPDAVFVATKQHTVQRIGPP